MKNFIVLLLLLIATLPVNAGNNLMQQADSAYTADNFKEAADTYLHVINTEGSSAELLYNLGNCYYRLGEMGKAVLTMNAHSALIRLSRMRKPILISSMRA